MPSLQINPYFVSQTYYYLQLSIIIVNYNVKFFLEQCLCSVLKAIQNIEAEIFVVDNNSTDDSKLFFKEKFNAVKFIWNNKNSGFAKANNSALGLAKGKYVLFLNPDTIVEEDCFIKCMSFFDSHIDAGGLGVHMIDGSGRFLKESKRSFPSPLTSLYKLSGLTKMFPRSNVFARYHLANLNENENSIVDVLAGAFMMIPKIIIDSLGGFDESFFMYGEDIDLSRRIQKAGYKNFYFAETTIIHFKGESAKKNSLGYVKMFYMAMSIFVKKHYGGGKTMFLNFLIQGAILLRALLSAAGRFIRWMGMPVLDAALILFSFWVSKFIWSAYIKQDSNDATDFFLIVFPVFTLIFLAASYFSGLYDNQYKQSKLNRSAATAIIVLLVAYAILPDLFRFPYGILVFGSLTAYGLMTLMRIILISSKVLDSANEGDELRKTIIAGTIHEFNRVFEFMQAAGMQSRILGRVEVNDKSEINSIGNIEQLPHLLNINPVKEVIFCEGELSFKKIIELVKIIPPHIRTKFHASCSESIIGSDSKNRTGIYFNKYSIFKLSLEVNKRNKQLGDVIISLIFIISFPVHLVLQKNPGRFFRNVSEVFFRCKTWIGYSTKTTGLPKLKQGVVSVTGLPDFMNTLPKENLVLADKWYAANFSLWQDVRIVWKSYKYLSV